MFSEFCPLLDSLIIVCHIHQEIALKINLNFDLNITVIFEISTRWQRTCSVMKYTIQCRILLNRPPVCNCKSFTMNQYIMVQCYTSQIIMWFNNIIWFPLLRPVLQHNRWHRPAFVMEEVKIVAFCSAKHNSQINYSRFSESLFIFYPIHINQILIQFSYASLARILRGVN